MKSTTGISFVVDIERSDKIDLLREKVAEKIHYTPGNVRLVYKDKQLENRRTLEDYNIANGDKIYASPRRID